MGRRGKLTDEAKLMLYYVQTIKVERKRSTIDHRVMIIATLVEYRDDAYNEYRKVFESKQEGFVPPRSGINAELSDARKQW